MRPTCFLLVLFFPALSFAQPLPCPDTLCVAPDALKAPSASEDLVAQRANGLILDAVAAEAESRWMDATRAYLAASAGIDVASSYLRQRAAAAAIQGGEPGIAHAIVIGEVDANLPGSGMVLVVSELASPAPQRDRIERSLEGPDREQICDTVFVQVDVRRRFAGLFHAHCTKPDEGTLAADLGHQPTFEERLRRGWRLYGDVRFRAARDELDRIDKKGLSPEQRCERDFLEARTTYRLRRRNDAAEIYERLAKTCKDEDIRVRSYYAWGDRRFDTGRLDEARSAFEAIVTDFSHRSHADDAWMYLGRIARDKKDSKLAQKAVTEVLNKHRDGDMLFEVVWEYLEPLYRAGAYEEFLTTYAGLDLPEHDNQYFSQGRLEYFAAAAARKLGRRGEAQRLLQRAWQKYPWSFYGYLSRLEMAQESGAAAVLERPVRESLPSWMVAEPRSDKALAISKFLRLGLVEHAADVAHKRPRAGVEGEALDQSRWLAAFANHRAGRFDYSHNVVRRKIKGRPWVAEDDGPRVQWHLAWPNPFGDAIAAANRAEGEQNNPSEERYFVDDALPASIMREESSFIEDIESYAGALGLMQLMPRTALAHDDDVEGSATPERLKTAEVNVRVGLDHLYWLARRFDSHPVLMVAAYNAGSGAVGKWLRRQPNDEVALWVEDIPYLQTRNYTKRVIGSYAAYQWLSGANELDSRPLAPAK